MIASRGFSKVSGWISREKPSVHFWYEAVSGWWPFKNVTPWPVSWRSWVIEVLICRKILPRIWLFQQKKKLLSSARYWERGFVASCGFAVMKKLLCTLAIPQAILTSSQGSSEGTRYPIDEPGPQKLTVYHAESASHWYCISCCFSMCEMFKSWTIRQPYRGDHHTL